MNNVQVVLEYVIKVCDSFVIDVTGHHQSKKTYPCKFAS